MFVCDGPTGRLLTFRKPSPKERRLNEASQPAESNLSTSILKRFTGQTVNRENRLLRGCGLAGVEASRMVPTTKHPKLVTNMERQVHLGWLTEIANLIEWVTKRATGGAEE